MTEREDAVALLEAAAARLDTLGWTRGTTGPHEGPNCIAGALCWAVADADLRAAHQLAINAWCAANDTDAMTAWNDRVCPDQATAADSLRLGAKWLAGHVPADGT